MNEPREIFTLVKQWVQRAEEDIQNASYSLTLGDRSPVNTVCFHCQQCAEKYLKAFLVLNLVQFPRTHDLVKIFNLSPDSLRSQIDLKKLVILNRYAIETRYPGDWEPVEI